MANNNSTTITNLEAKPRVLASVDTLYGKVREFVETFEIDAADNDGDTYALFPIQSGWRIADLQIVNDAITLGSDYDIGLYAVTGGTLGAVVDVDIYADGLDLTSARGVWTSVLFTGTGAKDQGAVKNRVWQDAGLSADPFAEYYLVVTANTVGTATGTLSVRAQFVVE